MTVERETFELPIVCLLASATKVTMGNIAIPVRLLMICLMFWYVLCLVVHIVRTRRGMWEKPKKLQKRCRIGPTHDQSPSGITVLCLGREEHVWGETRKGWLGETLANWKTNDQISQKRLNQSIHLP